MKVLLIIIFIALACFLLYLFIKHNLKNKTETITCYTGGLGAGKSLLSVEKALSLYRKQVKNWKRKKLLTNIYNFFVFWKKKDFTDEKPILLSNIPIRIENYPFNHKKDVYSYKLTKEHLLLQEKLPIGCVVLLDEVGSFASQWDYNQKNVTDVFGEFCRFFRHYTKNGYLVVNDQCSENINLEVRRRINTVHNLSNCFVFLHMCWYFDRQINISEEIKTIDKADISSKDTQDNSNLKFKFVFHKRSYDSHCYSNRYDSVPICEFIKHTKLKTNMLIKCPKDKDVRFIALTSNDDIKND